MRKIVAILFLFLSLNVFSQAQFELAVKDFLWYSQTENNINLAVLFTIKNIGNIEGVDDDINNLYLICSQPNYKFGKDITFIKFNNSMIQELKPDEEKLGYIIFNVPKAADNLRLTLPGIPEGSEKYICKSYYSYNNTDAATFQAAANDHLEKSEFTSAITDLFKANNINPFLHLNSQIDSVFSMVTQNEQDLTYYELFSNILTEQKQTYIIMNPKDKTPVKLKGNIIFCTDYSNGQVVGQSTVFSLGAGGGYLVIMLKLNRKANTDNVVLKIVFEGLLFDVDMSETKYSINSESDFMYFQNIYFKNAGTYNVTVSYPSGLKIASAKVKIVQKQ